jgi:hypothetical protein
MLLMKVSWPGNITNRAHLIDPLHPCEKPLMAGGFGNCDFCGQRAPVHDVSYRQNTGMLVMRQSRHYQGRACRGCSSDLFMKTTLHTLVLGWWGTISLFLTPIFIFSNIACWVGSRSLPKKQLASTNLLEERREYALNLLATKDEATVIDVLAKDTALPHDEVATWLRGLQYSRKQAS